MADDGDEIEIDPVARKTARASIISTTCINQNIIHTQLMVKIINSTLHHIQLAV